MVCEFCLSVSQPYCNYITLVNNWVQQEVCVGLFYCVSFFSFHPDAVVNYIYLAACDIF